MTSPKKPEIHNVMHCRQKSAEPRPQVTCTENFVKLGHVVFFEICQWTDKHTDTLMQYFASVPGRSTVSTPLTPTRRNTRRSTAYCVLLLLQIAEILPVKYNCNTLPVGRQRPPVNTTFCEPMRLHIPHGISIRIAILHSDAYS